MNLIKVSIERPIAIISAVIMVVLFGAVALQMIPIQLTPDVNRPVITIRTNWPGAAPAEVERQIVNEQEEKLKGLENLHTMTSESEFGQGRISLEFNVGTDMGKALLLTANRLDRVSGYPDEADEPTLDTAGSEDSPIAWFILTRQKGNTTPIYHYGDFVEDIIKDRIERVQGVSGVNIYGGSEQEIEVVIQPPLLARYGLTTASVVSTLRQASASVSAGDVDEGKRRYIVRTEGELNTVEAIRQVVLRSVQDPFTGGVSRVTVGDIAQVGFNYKEPTSNIRMFGDAALAFNATRETGANVIETMNGIYEALEELNSSAVPQAGLKLQQVYDETIYITSAIDLVQQNIWYGGLLAAVILLIFLRSVRATIIISMAIPVSVVGSFVAMAVLGRSINVISLAGLAFAVGMVVDAAIVVLENIFRLKEQGKSPAVAAYQGAQQVWGAILVSALTTVMVFIPILVMELEVGQLFRDIAVAISVSVVLSLVVSITVIPALSRRFLREHDTDGSDTVKRIPLPGIDQFGTGFVSFIMASQALVVRQKLVAVALVSTVTVIAALGTWQFLPKLEYLPEGNRNLVFGVIIPPPGYNLDTMTSIAKEVENSVRHLWATETGPESDPGAPPKMERFFFVATQSNTFLGATAIDGSRVAELIPVLQEPVFKEPGTFGFINQPSLFGRGIGGGRKIDLDISGSDLNQILNVAGQATGKIFAVFPKEAGNQFRPRPGLELGAPEVRVLPDRVRLADNGVSVNELGTAIDVFNDGLRVDEVTVGSKRLDLTLKGPKDSVTQTQGIASLPVVTSEGLIVPASSLAEIILTAGPTEIRHRERLRTITLEIRPAAGIPLEEALETLQRDVIAPLEAAGLPSDIKISLSGTADNLAQTWDAMIVNLLLAIVIVYLVMAVLFESFFYPLIILLAVPLATAGGVAGLAFLNSFVFQPLDMLTLLGFVILVGIVVNNAILVVHQTLYHLREENMPAQEAILEATRNRIRPIFMSTLTSVVGMLPLVLVPGAGSELYRGLGSVVVGGLSLSAVLTLLIIPPMLSLMEGTLERDRKRSKELKSRPGLTAEAAE
ncbi:efflux RND transporter permease subunit [Kiloniella laminariae]|uniref:Efflux RND transporter permease subunit n=1 Tax=Kiloniella laminariae TaxID=454162 RepID=A0ABT4LE09_9PROT|nr:efflux RND transporter permease subunit [Kiloniella laminariae]MCZ4279334.1 efflux RND transporter permease subunit [Kiloniella laminariae]